MPVRVAEPRPRAVYVITAERCPQILCRLIGLFAQQDRTVERLEAIDTGRIMRVTLCVRDIDPHRAMVIAEKMRQFVRVRTVKLQRPLHLSRPA